MNQAALQHLKNLFGNPAYAWVVINKASYRSKWILLKDNLSFFLIVNPLLFFIIHLVQFHGLFKIISRGILFPLIFNVLAIGFLIITALVIEEIYRLTSHKDPLDNVFKLFTFSSMPFFALSGFLDVPAFGKLIFLTGIVYSGYLFKVGLLKYLWTNKSQRRQVFLISSFAAIVVIIFALWTSFELLSIVKSYLLKLLK